MARRAKRTGSSSRKNRVSSSMENLKDRLTPSPTGQRILRGCGWFALIVAIGVGIGVGIPELESRAIARTRQVSVSNGVKVTFLKQPSLLRDRELQRLQDTVRAAVGERTSPLERDGLRDATVALEATGWFDRIDQVSWTAPGEIEISARYAIPVAVVRTRSGDMLVDTRGRRLPLTYDAGYAPLPVIKNPSQPTPANFGTPWPGGDVQAGIELLSVIHAMPWFEQVRSIDVGRFAAQDLLCLRTNVCTIVWGRRPGDPTIQEVPVEQKLDYLDYLHTQYGSIDAPCGHGEIDIRRDVVTSGSPT